MANRTPTRQATNVSTGNVSSITVTLPSAPQAGELIIVQGAHSDEGFAVTSPAGFVEDGFDAGAGVVIIFSKVADGTEGTTFTLDAPGPGSFAARVSCWNDLEGFDDQGSGMSRSTGTIQSGTLNTTAGNEIFAAFAIRAAAMPSDGSWADEFNNPSAAKVSTSGSTFNQQLITANYTSAGAAVADTYTYTEAGGSTTAYGRLWSYTAGEPVNPDPDPPAEESPTSILTVEGWVPATTEIL